MKLACCCHCACAVRVVLALCCGAVGVPLQGAWAGCCLLWMAVQGAAFGFFSEAAGGVARGEWLLSRYVIVARVIGSGQRWSSSSSGPPRKKNTNTGMCVCLYARIKSVRTGANRCEPVRTGANRCPSNTRRARCCNVYVCMCVCMCVCVYVCMCVCVYGMVCYRYVMVWYGMVWCGMVWFGMYVCILHT